MSYICISIWVYTGVLLRILFYCRLFLYAVKLGLRGMLCSGVYLPDALTHIHAKVSYVQAGFRSHKHTLIWMVSGHAEYTHKLHI